MLKTISQHDENELGPTTDLSLSLLAMVIIILVLVLIGNVLLDEKNQELTESAERLNKALQDTRTDNALMNNRNYDLKKKLANSQELYDQLRKSLASSGSENGDLNTMISNLVGSLARAQKEASKYKQLLNRKAIVFKLDTSKKTDLFDTGSNIVNSKALVKLISNMHDRIHLIDSERFNLLRVDGHASPEPHKCPDDNLLKDCNMELSAKRAIAVSQFLYKQDIPYECIATTGYGRTRSEKLMQVLEDNDITLQEWDKAYRQHKLHLYIKDIENNYRSYFDTFYSEDRRVDIVLAYEKDSKCVKNKKTKLLSSLKKISAAYYNQL